MMFKKIIALLFTCILIIALFSRVPTLFSERLEDTIWPIGHIICFAFWGWLLITFNGYIKTRGSTQQLIILFGFTLITGGGIELLQPLFSRSAQLSDLFYNFFGIFLAYIFFGNIKKSHNGLATIRLISTSLLLYFMFPTVQVIKDEYSVWMDFPTIAKFADSAELTRWKSDLPLSIVNSNDLPETRVEDLDLMKIMFAPKKNSRAALRFFSGDWDDYNRVKFSFFNPNQEPLKIRLIITDSLYNKSKPNRDDRFGKWLMIDAGWHDYYIDLAEIKNSPTQRELDLKHIAGVDFYMYKLKKPTTLYLNRMELI